MRIFEQTKKKMKTISEAANSCAGIKEGDFISDSSQDKLGAFYVGATFAQSWYLVSEELPEIKREPYQVLCKLAISGQYETYWVDHDTKNIEDECTHWQPIKHD